MTDSEIEALAYEEALAELVSTVSRLEEGDLSLEASLAFYERGQMLARHCSQLLNDATLRVEQLTSDGEIAPVDIDNG